MTRVDCYFVTPTGDPIVNSPVDIQPMKSGFTEEIGGIVMPRPAAGVTDAQGKYQVDLWPSDIPYFITCSDTQSDAVVFYKILVPVVTPGTVLRLQDLVIQETAPVILPGMRFDRVSNTQLRINVLGSDGVYRSAVINLA